MKWVPFLLKTIQELMLINPQLKTFLKNSEKPAFINNGK